MDIRSHCIVPGFRRSTEMVTYTLLHECIGNYRSKFFNKVRHVYSPCFATQLRLMTCVKERLEDDNPRIVKRKYLAIRRNTFHQDNHCLAIQKYYSRISFK